MQDEQHPPNPDALTPEESADLVQRIAHDQDKTAFSNLFAFYGPKVKAYIMRLGADGGTAEEVTQDVFMTLWRKAHMFDRRQASVATWIYTIARNRRIDLIRRAKRPEPEPDDPLLAPEPEVQPDAAVESAQNAARVRAEMETLPPEQRHLLELAFFKGLTHREIVEVTGQPLGTVKSRLRLAMTRLRKALSAELL